MGPDPYVRAAIVRAAQEHGIDPATALAIAERESSFSVHGTSGSPYSSARGLFQLLRAERAQYGGDSTDAYEQSTAWSNYIQPHKQHLTKVLGREPSGSELYFSHLIGPGRAARIVAGHIHPDTPIQDVMTPKELAANPFMVRAGTAGNLAGSVMRDIDRRRAKYGGEAEAGTDMASAAPMGQPPTSKGFDFAKYGELVEQPTDSGAQQSAAPAPPAPPTQPGSAPATPSIFSQFGEPVDAGMSPPLGGHAFSDKTADDLKWTAGIPMQLDPSKQSESIEDRRGEAPMGAAQAAARQMWDQVAEKDRRNTEAPVPVYSKDKMASDAGYNDIGQ